MSRNNIIYNGNGVQVLNLRFRMTRSGGGESYRFFTNRSELEMCKRGIQSVAKNLFFVFFRGCGHSEIGK